MSDPEVSPARVNPGQHGPGSQLASQPAQQQRWITKFVGITNHGLVISTWKVYCGFTGFLIIKLQLALAFNTLSLNNFWSKIWYFSIELGTKVFDILLQAGVCIDFIHCSMVSFKLCLYCFLPLCSIRPASQLVFCLCGINYIEPGKQRTVRMKYNSHCILSCIL